MLFFSKTEMYSFKAQKKHGKKTKKRKSDIFTGNRFFVLRPRYILQAFRFLFFARVIFSRRFVYYFIDGFV
ncbi:MAG TPA: hypothetical protein DCE65_09105 [Clostridiales bacterium]|nr:hypothetical protein [Clostridiales bacterium]